MTTMELPLTRCYYIGSFSAQQYHWHAWNIAAVVDNLLMLFVVVSGLITIGSPSDIKHIGNRPPTEYFQTATATMWPRMKNPAWLTRGKWWASVCNCAPCVAACLSNPYLLQQEWSPTDCLDLSSHILSLVLSERHVKSDVESFLCCLFSVTEQLNRSAGFTFPHIWPHTVNVTDWACNSRPPTKSHRKHSRNLKC